MISERAMQEAYNENDKLRCEIARQSVLIAELTAERDALAQENKRLVEFVRKISEQTPEKPDYWSSCSQCQHNSSDAEDLLEATVKEKP